MACDAGPLLLVIWLSPWVSVMMVVLALLLAFMTPPLVTQQKIQLTEGEVLDLGLSRDQAD